MILILMPIEYSTKNPTNLPRHLPIDIQYPFPFLSLHSIPFSFPVEPPALYIYIYLSIHLFLLSNTSPVQSRLEAGKIIDIEYTYVSYMLNRPAGDLISDRLDRDAFTATATDTDIDSDQKKGAWLD